MKIRGIVGLLGFGLLAVAACTTGGSGSSGADAGINEGGSGGTGFVLTGQGTKEPGQACDETEECVPGSVCFNEFCVGNGVLRISLAFDVDTDLDLYVDTPLGSTIYYGNREANGGVLDVDQCISSCGSGSHVENVVFDGNAPGGTYTVRVQNFDGRAAGAFTVEVAGAVNRTFSGSLPATPDAESEDFTFALANGVSDGTGGSGGTSSSSGGTSSSSEVNCEASCPSEFPDDVQLDAFCRSACCYVLTGAPANAEVTCEAGSGLGTSQCDYCE